MKKIFSKLALLSIMFALPMSARAEKMSDFFQNIATEVGIGSSILLWIIGIIGLFMFVWAFISFKKAKTENRDTGLSVVSMICGICLGLGAVLYGAMAESVTDQEYKVETEYNESSW